MAKKDDQTFSVICDKCGHSFNVDRMLHVQSIKATLEGELLTITWFQCPRCKSIYIVGISNASSEMLKKQFEKKRRKYQNSLGKEVPAVQTKLYEVMEDKFEKYKRYQIMLKQHYGEQARQYIYLRYVANR